MSNINPAVIFWHYKFLSKKQKNPTGSGMPFGKILLHICLESEQNKFPDACILPEVKFLHRGAEQCERYI